MNQKNVAALVFFSFMTSFAKSGLCCRCGRLLIFPTHIKGFLSRGVVRLRDSGAQLGCRGGRDATVLSKGRSHERNFPSRRHKSCRNDAFVGSDSQVIRRTAFHPFPSPVSLFPNERLDSNTYSYSYFMSYSNVITA